MTQKSKTKVYTGHIISGMSFVLVGRVFERNFSYGYEDRYRASWLLDFSLKLV